jgi:FkbM family methyltransferase
MEFLMIGKRYKFLKRLIQHPLNRNRKIKSILEFIFLQLRMRLKKPIVISYVNDSRLLVFKNHEASISSAYYGLSELAEMSFVLHFLREGDLMIDIGANIGTYTILASSTIGSNCISIEPIPDTFKHLKDNIGLNHINSKVECLNIGISDSNSKLYFTSNLDTMNRIVEHPDALQELIEVEVCNLDDLLIGKSPALIKIDVEGFEKKALKGAKKTLKNDLLKVVIMETFGKSNNDGIMKKYGFEGFSYLPFERKLIKVEEASSALTNTIYIRDMSYVRKRIKSALTFKVKDSLI